MPNVIRIGPRFRALQEAQDWVISREQVLAHGLTRHVIGRRLRAGEWQVLLPSVYLCQPAEPSRRQLMIGALLYVGPDAAIDAAAACRFHGVRSVAIDDDVVHVVVPWGSPTRSCGYVRVRRTVRPIHVVS